MTYKHCFFVLFISLLGFSQEKDSLGNALHLAYQNAKVDSVKIKTILQLSEYQVDNEFSEAKELVNKAFLLLRKPENSQLKPEMAMAYLVQGIIDRRTGNYVGSINNYMKSKAIYEELNDSINISSLLHNVGMVHRFLKEYRKSISYYKKAIELKSHMSNQTYEIGCSYNMLGVSYKRIKKRDSALWCYEKAIKLFTQIKKEKDIYRVKANMGVLFSDQKKYDQALVLYKESHKYHKKNNNIVSIANSYYNLSTLHKKIKKYELSMKYADSCIDLATKEGLKERRSLGLLRKSFLFKMSGNYKQAYEYYRKFNRASDSIHNIDNIKKIQELELNYEFNQEKLKDSLQFSLEKKEIQLIAENESSKKKLYLILFIVTLVLGSIIAFLLKRDFKNKKRLLELENKELLLEKDQISLAFEKLQNSTNSEDKIKAKHELLNLKILTQEDWNYFKSKFELLNPTFLELLEKSDFKLTKSEERFLILKKMHLDTKEIANMIGVSNDSVLKTQYRIRKKIGVTKEVNILDYIAKGVGNQ